MPRVPSHYVPRSLSKKDRETQRLAIRAARRAYTKKRYVDRPKLSSFRGKASPHVARAKSMYDVSSVRPSRALSRATGCSVKSLREIVRKGEGAYYSSGSRPNQTSRSWGIARLASAITGGPASKIDSKILSEGCSPGSLALDLAEVRGGGKMRERIIKFKKSARKGKKYSAIVENRKTRKQRIVHFGATGYQQYKDRTPIGLYKSRDHGDRRRMRNYFSRHSGTQTRKLAIEKEKRKSGFLYNPKILSHEYLW